LGAGSGTRTTGCAFLGYRSSVNRTFAIMENRKVKRLNILEVKKNIEKERIKQFIQMMNWLQKKKFHYGS